MSSTPRKGNLTGILWQVQETHHHVLMNTMRQGGPVTDTAILRAYHRFAWSETDNQQLGSGWGARMAKRYYEKLFREFALCDLSRYQEGKIGLRWRVEKEVVEGKGQFTCGNVACSEREELSTNEVLFKYLENEEVRKELVKVRCCPSCVRKLSKVHHRDERTISERTAKRQKLAKEAKIDDVQAGRSSSESAIRKPVQVLEAAGEKRMLPGKPPTAAEVDQAVEDILR